MGAKAPIGRRARARAAEHPGYSPQTSSERWIFTDAQDVSFRNPEPLLTKYRACMEAAPLRVAEISNRSRTYAEPYGFLSALSRLTSQVVEISGTSPQALRRTRPSLTFVYNARPYLLQVTNVRRVTSFRTRYGASRPGDVAVIEFRCFNTVRRTTTVFTLWMPLAGPLKGLPVRIVLQPRWWLRLQFDADLKTLEERE